MTSNIYRPFYERNLVRLIRIVERHMTQQIKQLFEKNGYDTLGARHLQLFENLDTEGSSIIALAKRAGISKQAMSKLVKETQALGLVDVKAHYRDSRFQIISPTAKGVELSESIYAQISECQNNMVRENVVTHEEINTTIDIFIKFLKNIKQNIVN